MPNELKPCTDGGTYNFRFSSVRTIVWTAALRTRHVSKSLSSRKFESIIHLTFKELLIIRLVVFAQDLESEYQGREHVSVFLKHEIKHSIT